MDVLLFGKITYGRIPLYCKIYNLVCIYIATKPQLIIANTYSVGRGDYPRIPANFTVAGKLEKLEIYLTYEWL